MISPKAPRGIAALLSPAAVPAAPPDPAPSAADIEAAKAFRAAKETSPLAAAHIIGRNPEGVIRGLRVLRTFEAEPDPEPPKAA